MSSSYSTVYGEQYLILSLFLIKIIIKQTCRVSIAAVVELFIPYCSVIVLFRTETSSWCTSCLYTYAANPPKFPMLESYFIK